MNWIKKGQVFAANGQYPWMHHYAQVPTVLELSDRLRVYFTCRPEREPNGNITSLTSFVDLDKDNPSEILYLHDRPILRLGEPGAFDHFGSMPAYAMRKGQEVWLYYVGWTRWTSVPYNHAIGLAISRDDGMTFWKYGRGPLFGRTPQEPYFQNSPGIFYETPYYHMWHSTGVEWIGDQGRMEAIYHLVHAISLDGVRWKRDGRACMPVILPHECQTCPTVIKLGGRYHMWFSYRYGIDFRTPERGYRIGYAWSEDLEYWHRDRDSEDPLVPSEDGWDSQMVCYPYVIKVRGKVYMFYSGNYFGQGGFGYAVLEEE